MANNNSDDEMKNPAIGGFPGYARGNRLFNAWSTALCASADGWNAVWAKMREGNPALSEMTKALVGSVDASATFLQQAVATTTGSVAPPWVVLQKQGATICATQVLARTIDPQLKVDVPLIALGAPQAAAQPLLFATAEAVDAHRVSIEMTEEQLRPVQEGVQYFGVVSDGKTSEPLAIVTLHVAPPKEAQAEVKGNAVVKAPPRKAVKKRTVKKKAAKKKAVKKKA